MPTNIERADWATGSLVAFNQLKREKFDPTGPDLEDEIVDLTHTWYLNKPQAAYTVPTFGRGEPAKVPEKPEGHIDRAEWMTRVFTAQEHRTKEDCQRYTNHEIVHLDRNSDGTIRYFSTWDGESWESPYFHSERCAAKQGYASAKHGDRYVWEKRGG